MARKKLKAFKLTERNLQTIKEVKALLEKNTQRDINESDALRWILDNANRFIEWRRKRLDTLKEKIKRIETGLFD